MLVLYKDGRIVKRFAVACLDKDLTFSEFEDFLRKWFEFDSVKWVRPTF